VLAGPRGIHGNCLCGAFRPQKQDEARRRQSAARLERERRLDAKVSGAVEKLLDSVLTRVERRIGREMQRDEMERQKSARRHGGARTGMGMGMGSTHGDGDGAPRRTTVSHSPDGTPLYCLCRTPYDDTAYVGDWPWRIDWG
jgi:hypothetical protein